MMMTDAPRVSIGLPVYNGAEFLREALDDLLEQDMPDFELIVSDNGSIDATPAIIAGVERRDRRVRVVRHAQNIGPVRNYESIIPLARAPYFMFAAHDDRWHPSYVRRMLDGFARHPLAVLACADSMAIDEYSQPNGTIYPSVDTVGLALPERVRCLISQFAWVEFYGLMRTDALRAIGQLKPYVGDDVVLLIELSVLGEITTIHEPLFRYRMPATKTTGGAYYASMHQSTRQDPQTYNALVRHLYRAVVVSRPDAAVLAAVRRVFIETLAHRNPAWLAALFAERGLPAQPSGDAAVALVSSLLDEAELREG